MSSILDEEYTTKFLELLKHVPYLKDEKEKIQRFISGFPLSFKDLIEFDEPQSLEEDIINLKHFHKQSKHKLKFKCDWKDSKETKRKMAQGGRKI